MIAFSVSNGYADDCTDGKLPNIRPPETLASFTVDQVFCDEFSGEVLNDQFWHHEIMHSDEHSVGYNRLLVDYELIAGRRWAAFYDNHLEKTAYVTRDDDNQGVLIQRGLFDRTISDTDKDISYVDPDDPDNEVNFGLGRLYTSFLKTYETEENNVNNSFQGFWGPGHYFEIRVNFGFMRMGGHRHSFWLMPATTDEYSGLSEVCEENDPVAYDCDNQNGVEIDIYEYEALPTSSRNKLYMKVLGGKVGKTDNSLSFHPQGLNYSDQEKSEVVLSSGFETGPLNVDQWHTVGLYWGRERLVWYIDGIPVVEDTEHVPTAPHYLLLTREMNSGVRENAGEGSVQTNYGSIPIDDGLAGENVGLRRNLQQLGRIFDEDEILGLESKDYVKTDYVRVWRISSELPPPVAPENSVDISDVAVIVNGNIIELSNGNEFEVSTLDKTLPKCVGVEGLCQVCKPADGPCQLSPGDYIVSDVNSGKRFDSVIVEDELPVHKSVSEKGGVFFFPRGHIYQVQSSDTFETICEGEVRCRVSPGSYNVINLDKQLPNREDNWEVSGTDISKIYIDSNNVINWPDENGWFQVQKYPELEVICEGTDNCPVQPGQYVVINHWTNERFEVNANGNQGEIIVEDLTRSLELNDARALMGIANAEDYFELTDLLRTATANPNRRPRITDNLLGTPTNEVGGVSTVEFNGEDIQFISSRSCPDGGVTYYFQGTTPQMTVFNEYYDNCRFLSNRLHGRYTSKRIAGSDQVVDNIDIRASIGVKLLQISGESILKSDFANFRREELTLSLLDVSTPSTAYTTTNAKFVIESDRDEEVPFPESSYSVVSRIRLTNFDAQRVNYLVNTSEPFLLNNLTGSIDAGTLTIENQNTMEIIPIVGAENEFSVTLRNIGSGNLQTRDVLMEDLRPAR